jgi:hypothetical protein
MHKIAALVPALALLASVASAESAAPPARTTSITVYGDDPCPKGEGDEIVVCAHEPESERYRIPKRFRQKPEDESSSRSWTDRVATVEEAGRASRPNSCSPVGANGQSGCTQAMLRQWFAEKRAAKQAASEVP